MVQAIQKIIVVSTSERLNRETTIPEVAEHDCP
jgi:hypothetical protein